MNYRFSLQTKSMLLTGSGEGGVLIDADVVFHPTGFPYVPAKRIKGMLKESMEEVLEIAGEDENQIKSMLNTLFGKQGQSTYQGKLTFSNLFIADWDNIKQVLKTNSNEQAFNPDFIKTFCTTEIQQTAINEDGVADPRSLRNYRVIKPDWTFETSLTFSEPLTAVELDWLKKAVNNLRYAGTRRNKGFGKIKCQIEALNPADVKLSTNEDKQTEDQRFEKLQIALTTRTPIVIAEQLGDQNTVFTSKQVSGNQVRGLLANAYIRKHLAGRNDAHTDPIFFEIFLSGKIQFGALTFNGCGPIPLHIHKFKKDKNLAPVSVFSKPQEITKPMGKQGIVKDGEIFTDAFEPATTFNFHNSRENRAAGRNTDQDTEGGIFYYESLNEEQTFLGEITGEENVLKQLKTALGNQFPARVGRSRAAQYGEVQIKLNSLRKNEDAIQQNYPAGKYILTLESPLVLFNQNGLPEPSAGTLMAALPSGAQICNAASAITTIEQFNSIWLSKSGKCAAFEAGSSFLLEFKSDFSAFDFLGEWNEQGFGKIRLEPHVESMKYQLKNGEEETPEKDQPMGIVRGILTEIQAAYAKAGEEIKVKTKAIKDAENSKGLLNHQIGRLERLFENSEVPEEISTWISKTKDKPAGDALKKAGLVDDNHIFNLKQSGATTFALQRIYWITFFQTLRKKNKSNG